MIRILFFYIRHLIICNLSMGFKERKAIGDISP